MKGLLLSIPGAACLAVVYVAAPFADFFTREQMHLLGVCSGSGMCVSFLLLPNAACFIINGVLKERTILTWVAAFVFAILPLYFGVILIWTVWSEI